MSLHGKIEPLGHDLAQRGGGAHADTEHVIVATMPERARLVAGIVAALGPN